MSIFQHPLLLIFFSLLLCPVASQTGQQVKEVTSGLPTSAELIASAADCQAAAKLFGLAGTVQTFSRSGIPPGCVWFSDGTGDFELYFNTNITSTTGCDSDEYVCLCVDPCPIGNYQNEESSKTCKSCLAGTYNDETGRSSCQNCTIGKYNNEIGESTCKNCPAGENSTTGASNCKDPICCQAKANYSKYEKNCNMIKDATACYLIQFDHLDYTCNWNCDVTTVMDMHNVSQK